MIHQPLYNTNTSDGSTTKIQENILLFWPALRVADERGQITALFRGKYEVLVRSYSLHYIVQIIPVY